MNREYGIRIDTDRQIGSVNRNIYGHFTEHLRRCIYGGIYEENSPLSDKDGFRKDVLDAVKKIKCPILRWPGGNFASNYHWEDGIGPKNSRPVRFDLAWAKEETNRFGTEEFIRYCRKTGAEPYVCINLGTGRLDEAVHWLEYCNSLGNTEYAKLREKMGHKEPYRIKYWGVGNEHYGDWQVGYRTATEYAKVLREYAQFMKKVDPEIKIVAVGADDPDWDLEVVRTAGEYIDCISNHQYLGSNDYYGTMGSVYWVEKRLRMLEGIVEAFQPEDKDIKIAFDEWGLWYSELQGKEKEKCTLKEALFVAGVFLVLHRMCNRVTLANKTQLVNVSGTIRTTKESILLTPVYHVFDLFVNHTGDTVLNPLIVSDTYSTDTIERISIVPPRQVSIKHVPYLDASATLSTNRKKLSIVALNYHQDQEIPCSIVIDGFRPKNEGKVFELNGSNAEDFNDFENPERVRIVSRATGDIGSKFIHNFAPHSVTVLELDST